MAPFVLAATAFQPSKRDWTNPLFLFGVCVRHVLCLPGSSIQQDCTPMAE